MTPRFAAVLFDLDGTLTESHPGILHCVRLSLGEMGLPIPDEAVLRRFIGPPLWYSYTEFCGLTPEQADEGVARYRQHYRDGGFLECAVYPGMLPLLDDLRAAGVKLAVATAKPAKMARAVCEHFGILERVDFLSGKRGLIETACAGLGVSPALAVMVGDTKYDLEGAREAGAAFVGAAYGYGAPGELTGEGSLGESPSPDGLRSYLFL